MLAAVIGAVQVDAQHVVPLLFGHILELRIPGNAGIVDQDVDPPKGGQSGLCGRGHLSAVRYIAADGDGIAAQLHGGLLRQTQVVVPYGHTRGLFPEKAGRYCGPNPLARAGNNGKFPL